MHLTFPADTGNPSPLSLTSLAVAAAAAAAAAAWCWRPACWGVCSVPDATSLLQDDNVEDCPVCLDTFDDTLRRPRTLPCGHTVCTLCSNELKAQGAVTCPTCRVSHAVPEVGQFPISYAIEGLVRRLRGAGLASLPARPGKQAAPAPLAGPAPKAAAGLGRRAQSLLQEQEARVLDALRSCQEEQSQLADYLTTLGGWGDRQQRLEDELQTLMDQSRSAREVVRGEEARVERRQEQVQRRQQELQEMLESLRMAATKQEAYQAIEDADLLVDEQESPGTEECLGVFPDVQAVTTVARVSHSVLMACLLLTLLPRLLTDSLTH